MKKNLQDAQPSRLGLFENSTKADIAIKRLLAGGFSKDEVGVLCASHCPVAKPDVSAAKQPEHRPESATALATGGAVGAALGGLALAASALVTGGASLLAGGAVLIGGGALAGTFTGAMATVGFDDKTASHVDDALNAGQILVTVTLPGANPSDQRLKTAERILRDNGAVHVLTERTNQ